MCASVTQKTYADPLQTHTHTLHTQQPNTLLRDLKNHGKVVSLVFFASKKEIGGITLNKLYCRIHDDTSLRFIFYFKSTESILQTICVGLYILDFLPSRSCVPFFPPCSFVTAAVDVPSVTFIPSNDCTQIKSSSSSSLHSNTNWHRIAVKHIGKCASQCCLR